MQYRTFGVVALPLVVVSAFLTGPPIWRVIPVASPVIGGIVGFVTTGLTYIISQPLLFPVVLVVS